MITRDGTQIEVGYIIGYDAHLGRPLAPDRPIPEMEEAQVLEIDEANERLTVVFADGRRAVIEASEALGPVPQEEWARQYGKTWRAR